MNDLISYVQNNSIFKHFYTSTSNLCTVLDLLLSSCLNKRSSWSYTIPYRSAAVSQTLSRLVLILSQLCDKLKSFKCPAINLLAVQ